MSYPLPSLVPAGNIRVFCRCKPASPEDVEASGGLAVQTEDGLVCGLAQGGCRRSTGRSHWNRVRLLLFPPQVTLSEDKQWLNKQRVLPSYDHQLPGHHSQLLCNHQLLLVEHQALSCMYCNNAIGEQKPNKHGRLNNQGCGIRCGTQSLHYVNEFTFFAPSIVSYVMGCPCPWISCCFLAHGAKNRHRTHLLFPGIEI